MASEKKPRKNASASEAGPKDKVVSSAAAVPPRFFGKYKTDVVPALTKQFGYKNPNQVPKLEKIVVNMGLGAAVTNPKIIDAAVDEVRAFTGLKPVIKPQTESLAADEVNLQILQPPEMPAALAAGKIDGYIVAEPFDALGELKAGGKILRFTGDIWKNHPCCVVAMHEEDTVQRPEWSQKVVNAVVRAEVYASHHKTEVAQLISQEGKGYLPLPAAVVERAITHYDDPAYTASGANRNHGAWHNGRIDFQPWPYPSATKAIVKAMNTTVVSGDKTFLNGLDPDFVARDLVNYPDWKTDPSVNAADPFQREEVFSL